MPAWSSTFDAPWGNAATWSIVAGGQAGNALQAQRSGTGSSQKVKVYNISASTSYTISVYVKCPSSSAYWAECAYKLGSFTAQDFDANAATWTQIKKFSDNARDDIRAELGPDFADFQLTDLDPRRAVRKYMQDAWDEADAESPNGTKPVDLRPGLRPLAKGERPPYDADAT